jgi:C4-dicarboxylate-specific signal transduction histidine kinase
METLAGRNRLLRVKTDRHGSDAVIVVVEDSGPGIEPTRLHGIFEAFVTTKKKGMGLRLAICRQIIENRGKLNLFQTAKARRNSFYQLTPKCRSAE